MAATGHALDHSSESEPKLTKNRKMVFETMYDLRKPVTAYQLLELLRKKTGKQIDPPTIYRALAFLQEQKLVMKVEGLNAFMLCKTGNHGNDHVLLICDSCGNTDEHCGSRLANDLAKSANLSGFRPSRQVIELHGECASCQD